LPGIYVLDRHLIAVKFFVDFLLSKESQSLAAYVTLADKLTPGTAKCLTGALKKLRIFQAFLRGAPFAFYLGHGYCP